MLMKYVAYLVLIGVYAVFAWRDPALVGGFVAVLTAGAAGLGVYHANDAAAVRATNAANLANPVPPPQPVVLPTSFSKETP